MASGIDAIIAQGPRPVQVDPNAIANRVLTLRQAYQQQQLGKEQLTAARQENEQRQIQMDQTRAINQAYQAALTTDADGNPTIDRTQLTQALSKNGHGSAIPAIMKQLDETELAHTNLVEAKGKVAIQEKDYAASIGAATKAANGDPQLFMTLATNAVRQKHVDPHVVQPLIDHVTQALQQDPSGAAARQMTSQIADQMIGLSPTVQDAQAKATEAGARQSTAKTEADKAQLAKDNQFLQQASGASSQQQLDQLRQQGKAMGVSDAALGRLPAMFSPDAMQGLSTSMMTAKERADTENQKATRTEVNRHNEADEAAARTRNNIAAGELALGNKKFNATLGAGLDANGQPLPVDQRIQRAKADPTAVAISEYRLPPITGRALTSGPGKVTMDNVQLLTNNTYDGSLFPTRNKTAMDYAPGGKIGQQLTSTDTALAHIDQLSRAGFALKNNDFRALNAIANEVGAQIGGTAKATYDAINEMVSPEITKAVIGNAGGVGERQGMAKNWDSSQPDQTRESALGSAANLLGARWDKNSFAYKQQMGRDMPRELSPESQKVLNHYRGGQQGGGAQQGGQYPPLPATLSQNDVGKVYMSPKTGKPVKITAVNPKDATQFKSEQVQ